MQNKFIFCAIVLLLSFSGFAQQLPLNTCGIVHVYDASGNRIKRVYFLKIDDSGNIITKKVVKQ